MIVLILLTIITIFISGVYCGLMIQDEKNDQPINIQDIFLAVCAMMLGIFFLVAVVGKASV